MWKRFRIVSLIVLVLVLISTFFLPSPMEIYLITGKLITGQQTVSGVFLIILDPDSPRYSNVQQSSAFPYQGTSVVLSAYWDDQFPLDYAWLATNETGVWENKTGVYDSMLNLSGNSSISIFTWQNNSIPAGNIIAWRIYANDTSGNVNVTYDTTFFLRTPPTPPPVEPPGGGGGGGFAPTPTVKNFTIDTDFIKVSVKQGETVTKTFQIMNIGNSELAIVIENEELQNLVSVEEPIVRLMPNEVDTVILAFSAKVDEIPDVYSGKIIARANGMTKEIFLVVEVKETKPLFDVQVILDKLPYEALPGELVEGDIVVYNLGDAEAVDVTLHYALRDISKKELFYEEDTFMVVEQKLVRKAIRIPKDASPGYYLFYVKVDYDGQTATSSGLIRVVTEAKEPVLDVFEPGFLELMIGITWISIMIVLFFLVLIYKRTKKVVIETHKVVSAKTKSGKPHRLEVNKVTGKLEDMASMVKEMKKRGKEKEIIVQAGARKTINMMIKNVSKNYVTMNLEIRGLPVAWYEIKRDSAFITKTDRYADFKIIFKPPAGTKGDYKFFYVVKAEGIKETTDARLKIYASEKEALKAEIEMLREKAENMRSVVKSGNVEGSEKIKEMLDKLDDKIKDMEKGL